MRQQIFNGSSDRVKYAGDAMVDMLINTETDDTILDHWPSVLPLLAQRGGRLPDDKPAPDAEAYAARAKVLMRIMDG
jgi:hypothetical protein